MSSVIMSHGDFLTTALIHFLLLRSSATCAARRPLLVSPFFTLQVIPRLYLFPISALFSEHSSVLAGGGNDDSWKPQAVADEKIRLGSTPPSCHNRCNACHPCKAVQVPTMLGWTLVGYRRPAVELTGSNYYSNYKPLGWMCICGSRFFNP